MGGGDNLAPPPTGYRRAIARSAVQKTAGAQSEDVPLFTRRRTGGEWVKEITWLYCWGEQQTPHHRQQAIATPRKVGT